MLFSSFWLLAPDSCLLHFLMLSSSDVYVPQCGATGMLARRRALAAWSLLMLGAVCLLGLILAAPWASAHGYNSFASTLYRGFGYVCHQIPTRSFQFEEHPFAVCARCTGIYAGFALGLALYPLVRRDWRRATTPARVWLFIAAGPIIVDFALGFFGVWENTHFSRLLTGAFFGAVCAFFIVPAVIEIGRSGWPRWRAHAGRDKLEETSAEGWMKDES
jgi:uncharacterized membrane protein